MRPSLALIAPNQDRQFCLLDHMGRGAARACLLQNDPLRDSCFTNAESETAATAQAYVILGPVADAVSGLGFHGSKTLPSLPHPPLFMHQRPIRMIYFPEIPLNEYGRRTGMKQENEGQNQSSNTVKDPDEWTTGSEPMTGAQRSYLKTLSDEAGEPFDENLTKAEASKRIDELQQKTGRGVTQSGPGNQSSR